MYVSKYVTITHDIVYSCYSRVLWFGDVSTFTFGRCLLS